MNSCSKLEGTVGKYRQEGGGQGYISKHVLYTHSASVMHEPIRFHEHFIWSFKAQFLKLLSHS